MKHHFAVSFSCLLSLGTTLSGCHMYGAPSTQPSPKRGAAQQHDWLQRGAQQHIEQQRELFRSLGAKDAKVTKRDTDGRPVFDPTHLRGTGDSPYACFSLVHGDGGEVTQCEPNKNRCVNAMQKAQDSGRVILSGCRPSKTASCYIVYGYGAALTTATPFCWKTPTDCKHMNDRQLKLNPAKDVSTCEQIDVLAPPKQPE